MMGHMNSRQTAFGDNENDLDYFEHLIAKFQQEVAIPLLERHQHVVKEDPYEEIHDLFNEIKDAEHNFKKVLDIACKS
jgi:hydroxymethylpyrimidine pyrophosphatase-like HAD family hydrolase